MNSVKILVTGSNGFIGQAFCRRLITLGCEVYGLDRNAPEVAGFKDFYRQDITQSFSLKQNFDFVFHLAAYNVTHVGCQTADLYHRINVQGTGNVLQAVKTRHFIFLSTTKVYWAQGKPLDEEALLLPLQEYEKSKLAAEQVCREGRGARELLIFRCVNIVGPGQTDKAVIPVLFKRALAGETLKIFGPRQSVLQLLFVEDAIDAFIKVIEKGNVSGIFNIASENLVSLDELAKNIKRICRSKSEIHFMNDEEVEFSKIICVKAEKILGWKAKATLKDILEQYQRSKKSLLFPQRPFKVKMDKNK